MESCHLCGEPGWGHCDTCKRSCCPRHIYAATETTWECKTCHDVANADDAGEGG